MSRFRNITIVVVSLVIAAAVWAKPKPAPAAEGAAPSDPNALPIAPKDAQWTIYCRAIGGPDHVARANVVKQDLMSATAAKGMKGWYVVHEEDQSVIYYGFYRTTNDPKDAKETSRAQNDIKLVAAQTDALGNKIFEQCLFQRVPAPDPEANPQWDLRRAPGFWSVEIAVYKDSPERKQAAVDSVKALREHGEEAYYYHGETASSVCVGAWPRDAVREQESDKDVFRDPTHDLLVLPGVLDMPSDTQIKNRDGDTVNAVAPRREIVDPSLTAMMAKYPTRALNGQDYVKTVKDPVTQEEKQVTEPSWVVPVPQETASILSPSRQNVPQLIVPTTPSTATPGTGKLKTIGQ